MSFQTMNHFTINITVEREETIPENASLDDVKSKHTEEPNVITQKRKRWIPDDDLIVLDAWVHNQDASHIVEHSVRACQFQLSKILLNELMDMSHRKIKKMARKYNKTVDEVKRAMDSLHTN